MQSALHKAPLVAAVPHCKLCIRDLHLQRRILGVTAEQFHQLHEADEVTYNLHIMLRYELEKKIFNDNLSVDDIPETWNQMFSEWFGIEVPEDRLGCLQDIHWSMAAFGYFPTYTLGNLYAAQLLAAMGEELGDVDKIVESGNWQPMLGWLRSKIHLEGSKWTPSELIEHATGAPPTPQPFIDYVEKKYGELYNL